MLDALKQKKLIFCFTIISSQLREESLKGLCYAILAFFKIPNMSFPSTEFQK